MPYKIIEQKDKKFKVCKADDIKVCFSKKGIPYKTARKQVRAIVSSENKKGSKKGKGRTLPDLSDREVNRWYKTHERRFISQNDGDDGLWDFAHFKEEYKKKYENTYWDHSDIMKDLLQSNLDEADSEQVTALSPEEIKERKSMLENQKGMEKAEKETKEYNEEYDRIELMKELYKEFQEAEKEGKTEYTYETLDDFIQEYERLRGDTDYSDPSTLLQLIIDPFEFSDEDTRKAVQDGKELYEEIENLSPNFYFISGSGKKSPNINTNNSSLMYLKHFLLNRFKDKTNEKDPNTGVYKKGLETITTLWIDYQDNENFGGDYDEQQVDDWQKNLSGVIDIDQIETILYDPNNWLIDRYYKNEVREDCKRISQKANQMDSGEYWCENMCAGVKMGGTNFSISTSGLVALNFYKDGDNIVFSGMDNSDWDKSGKNVHINYKCSSRYGFRSFNALREIAQNNGQGDLCYLPKLKTMDLMSMGYYSTVMFYWRQGAYGSNFEASGNYAKDNMYRFLEKRFKLDTYEKALNVLLDEFENIKGCTKIKDLFFASTSLGGYKYYKLDKSEEDYLYKRDIEIKRLENENPNKNVLYSEFKTATFDREEKTNKNPELMVYEVLKQIYEELPTENIDFEEFNQQDKIIYNKLLIFMKNKNKIRVEDNEPLLPIPTRQTFLDVLSEYRKREGPGKIPTTNELSYRLEEMTTPSRKQIARKGILSYAKKLKKERENPKPIVIQSIPPRKTDPKGKTGRRPRGTQGSGLKGTKFFEELRSYGIKPEDYLKQMKTWAKKSGYDEKQMTLDTDDKHKLRILTIDGTKHFGRVGYKDYYIYRHLEKNKKVKKGYAKIMRDRFRKSHGAISKKRKLGRNSANELSLRILWHEEDDEVESKKKGLN
jgi:hypothetical protein